MDATEMQCAASEGMGIFTVTKPFRVGYGDSFGCSIDVEFEDEGGYVAFGICPPNWDFNQPLHKKGAVCVRFDGAFSSADRDSSDGEWDISQCHPLLNVGGTVSEPPLTLEAAPPSPYNTGKIPSPKRPPRVAAKALQDGRLPTAG